MTGEKLYSPEQLPAFEDELKDDGKDDGLVFVWDQENADSIIFYGDRVIWRERTGGKL